MLKKGNTADGMGRELYVIVLTVGGITPHPRYRLTGIGPHGADPVTGLLIGLRADPVTGAPVNRCPVPRLYI